VEGLNHTVRTLEAQLGQVNGLVLSEFEKIRGEGLGAAANLSALQSTVTNHGALIGRAYCIRYRSYVIHTYILIHTYLLTNTYIHKYILTNTYILTYTHT
jgi:hypothetical protein